MMAVKQNNMYNKVIVINKQANIPVTGLSNSVSTNQVIPKPRHQMYKPIINIKKQITRAASPNFFPTSPKFYL